MQPHLMIGMVNTVPDISNRDVERLFDKYNPNSVRTGDRVIVKLYKQQYVARIVGLDLDIKNKKVFANLKLADNTKRLPIRVDCADCYPSNEPIYPGHHKNG